MAEDDDQKTEQPTGKRLGDAREEGQIPVSREASMWVSMLGIVVVLGWVVPPMIRDLAAFLLKFIASPHEFVLDDNSLRALMFHIFGQVALMSGLAFLLMIAMVVIGYMLQTGFFFSLNQLSFDLTKLSPLKGFKKLFSVQSLVELGKSMFKLVVLGGVAAMIVLPVAYQSPQFTGFRLEKILDFLHHQVLHLTELLLAAFTVVAAADLFFTRYQYTKNLRMTKAEVKDEHRQMEGDPMIKSRLRQLRVEKARKRMMAQVPKADVIITNPTHYAVALQYDAKKMAAPVVLAKGINLIAERIRAIAEENRIPLVSNPPLARALHDTVEIDHPIPTQHYRAVAEVISYVYKLRKRRF